MSMDFERVYELEAQSPLLHFQYAEDGATLRVTEVKPKLDRFLYECAKKEGKTDLLTKNKIDKDKDKEDFALNYKMRIEATRNTADNSPLDIENYKFYFGNMGDGAIQKNLVFKNVKVTILAFDTELLNYIDEKISDFFIITNFGARQSKGFGSFLVKTEKGEIPDSTTINKTIRKYFNSFFYANASKANALQKHNHALTIYTVLKNGINLSRYNQERGTYRSKEKYIKGFVLRQFLPDNVGSDKAFMKSKIKPTQAPRGKEPNQNYTSYKFIRALFGLANQYEFRDDMRNNGTGINRNGNTYYKAYAINFVNYDGTTINNGMPIVPIDSIKNDKGIKRFKSPLLIKIFQNRIYFIFDNSQDTMLNQIFIFMDMEQHRNYQQSLKNKKYEIVKNILKKCKWIKTPSEFDADAFIERFIEYYHSENIQHRISALGTPYSDSLNLKLTKGQGNGAEQ